MNKGNVLITPSGMPVLTDFGISRVHDETDSMTIDGTRTFKTSEIYLAIELLMPRDEGKESLQHEFHTKESDIWAFAMVVYVSMYPHLRQSK